MRVTTKLRAVAVFAVAIILIAIPFVFWSINATMEASDELKLANDLHANFIERSSQRDRYFVNLRGGYTDSVG